MNTIVRHTGHHVRRHLRQLWLSRGGGFYGFAATVTFLYLEAISLLGDLTTLGSFRADLGGIIGWLVNNFVAGILNAVWAAIWPAEWIKRFGVNLTSAALLAGCYLVFLLIRPTVLRLLRDPDEENVAAAELR